MCNLFYIPVIVISKQFATELLIPAFFSIFSKGYTQFSDQPQSVPMVDYPYHITV